MNTTSSKYTLRNGIRHAFSLTAFMILIAAVTMAFADVPSRHANERTELHFNKSRPSVSHTPAPAVRLASGSTRRSAAKSSQSESKSLTGTLNLNVATVDELIKLPGIGPKKAALIVKWRKAHGHFRRVVDLRRVKGFGAKSVKKLLPYLAVSGKNTLQ